MVPGPGLPGARAQDTNTQVSLEEQKEGIEEYAHICGASVLNDNWALTAAHCFLESDNSEFQTRAGSVDNGKGGTVHDVVKIIAHEDFGEESSFNNDIAVIKVGKPYTSNSYVKFVKLPKPGANIKAGIKVIATGWGITTLRADDNVASEILLDVTLDVIDNEICQKAEFFVRIRAEDPEGADITDNMFCTLTEGKDTGAGDSGGPILARQSGDLIQIGIVSYGEGSGHLDAPGMYTKVSKYRDWISNEISSD
uniref:Peptidase S1 domain-containing protein n=1 Tax=Timema bartmani TaxID=61472 RepID=A0A7R9F1L0_9NEOP|nr:unnamed protein product [Timema bartmani]